MNFRFHSRIDLQIVRALVLALAMACAPFHAQGESASGKLTVAVAASMRFSFEDLVAAFQTKEPAVEIVATYGASGSFYAQIVQRAPFDVFLSADTGYPDRLVAEGLGEAGFLYAVGRLVLWAPKSAGLRVAERGMGSLGDPKIIKISMANPALAPYGRAAEAALKHAKLDRLTAGKVVRAENVSQALQFVQSGAAQIGFTAYSLAMSKELRAGGDFWMVPEELHLPLLQSGVVIPWSKNRRAATALREFILSHDGRVILERHGFGAPRS